MARLRCMVRAGGVARVGAEHIQGRGVVGEG
jgi:hypothetical protein